MRRLSNYCLGLALCISATAIAESPAGSWLQLHNLNQTNQQKLKQLQGAYTQQRSATTSHEHMTQQQLNRQQRLQQQALQRSHQHQRLIQEQRNRITPSDHSRRLDGVFRQQQFRQNQQQQLQRFQLQQQLRR